MSDKEKKEKKVKRLLPKVNKKLRSNMDLVEAYDFLNKYINLNDTEDMIIEQLDFSIRMGLIE